MQEYAQAVILGAIQALTEFLPISSSGHLLIAERVMGSSVGSLTFDVGLHVGTLLAVLVYFRADWLSFVRSGVYDITHVGVAIERWSDESKLGLAIVIGTVPAVVAGLLLGDTIEANVRSPYVVAAMLIAVAAVMYLFDRRPAERSLSLLTLPGALLIGMAQALALVPGVSRSGITISAARGLNFERGAAARFSFLLSAPTVLGAVVLKLGHALGGSEQIAWGPMAVGALTSGILGWLVIKGLLAFLRNNTLRPFVWYRIALGLAVLGAAALGAL